MQKHRLRNRLLHLPTNIFRYLTPHPTPKTRLAKGHVANPKAAFTLHHPTLPLFHCFGRFADARSPRMLPIDATEASEPPSTARRQLHMTRGEDPRWRRNKPRNPAKSRGQTSLCNTGPAATTTIPSGQSISFAEKRVFNKTEYWGVVLQRRRGGLAQNCVTIEGYWGFFFYWYYITNVISFSCTFLGQQLLASSGSCYRDINSRVGFG